jgi:hypothetical protein
MPEMVGIPGGDSTAIGSRFNTRCWHRSLATHAANAADAKMQSGSGQHLCDLDFPKTGTQRLQALDQVANEVGKLVDRLGSA